MILYISRPHSLCTAHATTHASTPWPPRVLGFGPSTPTPRTVSVLPARLATTRPCRRNMLPPSEPQPPICSPLVPVGFNPYPPFHFFPLATNTPRFPSSLVPVSCHGHGGLAPLHSALRAFVAVADPRWSRPLRAHTPQNPSWQVCRWLPFCKNTSLTLLLLLSPYIARGTSGRARPPIATMYPFFLVLSSADTLPTPCNARSPCFFCPDTIGPEHTAHRRPR